MSVLDSYKKAGKQQPAEPEEANITYQEEEEPAPPPKPKKKPLPPPPPPPKPKPKPKPVPKPIPVQEEQEEEEPEEEEQEPQPTPITPSSKTVDLKSFYQDPKERKAMSSWIKANQRQAQKLNLASKQQTGAIEMNRGSWAIIYKGATPLRTVPFVWQQDAETRQPWAVFDRKVFYGQSIPKIRFKIQLLLIPIDKSPNMCNYLINGYYMKFDEATEMQIPLEKADTPEAQKKRVEEKTFVSQNLMLARMLQNLQKPKTNWTLIIVIAIVIILVVGGIIYYMSNPNMFAGLTHLFPGT